jgi:hypothetical protein
MSFLFTTLLSIIYIIKVDVERYNNIKLLNNVIVNERTFTVMTTGRKQEQYS